MRGEDVGIPHVPLSKDSLPVADLSVIRTGHVRTGTFRPPPTVGLGTVVRDRVPTVAPICRRPASMRGAPHLS